MTQIKTFNQHNFYGLTQGPLEELIHSKCTVESKLSSLNLPAASSKEIIKDIYGNMQGTHKSEGLVHAPDVEQKTNKSLFHHP